MSISSQRLSFFRQSTNLVAAEQFRSPNRHVAIWALGGNKTATAALAGMKLLGRICSGVTAAVWPIVVSTRPHLMESRGRNWRSRGL